MNQRTSMICVAIAITVTCLAVSVSAQSPTDDSKLKGSGPNGAEFPDGVNRIVYYPAMSLGHRPGTYLTIEGVSGHNVKGGQPFVVVDTVNGKKLAKSIIVPIRNARISDKERCVLKGYETGKMVGEPPAVREAAQEQGKELAPSALVWRWETYFVALISLKQKNVVIDELRGITKP